MKNGGLIRPSQLVDKLLCAKRIGISQISTKSGLEE
jgi:hypothetical protein